MARTATCQKCGKEYSLSMFSWDNEFVCRECFLEPGRETKTDQEEEASRSEGVWRLSILAGALGALCWLGWAWDATEGFDTLVEYNQFYREVVVWREVAFVVGGAVGFFLVPWAFVHAAAWVVRGFQKDREEK